MKDYGSEDGLKFLKLGGISLSEVEAEIFIEQFNGLWKSCSRYENFIGTLWDIYSNILPFKAHPNRDGRFGYLEHLSRDEIFKEKIIDSGLSERLEKVNSIDELTN
jgi:hypothetical protein